VDVLAGDFVVLAGMLGLQLEAGAHVSQSRAAQTTNAGDEFLIARSLVRVVPFLALRSEKIKGLETISFLFASKLWRSDSREQRSLYLAGR
jgi:hypothetical protein